MASSRMLRFPEGFLWGEEIYPYGLYWVLKAIYQRTRGNKPLYITENGLRDAADSRRPQALLEHLAMMHRAMREGVPVRGYLHWTLVDDFEWTEGWRAHLGLVATQYTFFMISGTVTSI